MVLEDVTEVVLGVAFDPTGRLHNIEASKRLIEGANTNYIYMYTS